MAASTEEIIPQQETWIPVSLALYAEWNDLIEELKLYLTMKLYSSGKIKAKSAALKAVKVTAGAKSRTTYNKRLGVLKRLNWIGYNQVTGCYFVRSITRICKDLDLPATTCVEFQINRLKDFRLFVFAAIVGLKIKQMEYAKKRSRQEVKLVPQYWEGTNPGFPPPLLNYNGLPNSAMSKLTGKSASRCSELKNLAEKAGFLLTREKLILVDILEKSPILRQVLKEKYPDKYGRFKLRLIKRGINRGKVKVMELMADEIIPLLRYRNRKW